MIYTSSRDPDGYLVSYNGNLFRIILSDWQNELDILVNNVFGNYSIPQHFTVSEDVETEVKEYLKENGYSTSRIIKILNVDKLDPVTYPWEWTPSMLVKAAIFMLRTQLKLMESDLSLKDGSSLNLHFMNEKLLFLDLLSIKKNESFYPWIPYGQFLRHFIYPLTLLKYSKIENLKLLWYYQDGIDLMRVKNLIPGWSAFNLFEFLHYTIGSRIKKEIKNMDQVKSSDTYNTKQKLTNLLEWNLRYLESIETRFHRSSSFWKDYYNRDVSDEYFYIKKEILTNLFRSSNLSGRILDLGANTGKYSTLFLDFFNNLICLEKDTASCEVLFSMLSVNFPAGSGKNWTVINSDILNPDPGLGWMNSERDPLIKRIRSEYVAALGLIHHLYFTGSIDFIKQADLFSNLSTKYLIAEFISPVDDKVDIISRTNPVRLKYYNRLNFLDGFLHKFEIAENINVNETREIFLFIKK